MEYYMNGFDSGLKNVVSGMTGIFAHIVDKNKKNGHFN